MQYAIPVIIDAFGNWYKQNRNEKDAAGDTIKWLQPSDLKFIKQENSVQHISREHVVDSQIFMMPPSPPPMPPQPQIEYKSAFAKTLTTMESGEKLTALKNQHVKPIFSDINLRCDFLGELKARVSRLKLDHD